MALKQINQAKYIWNKEPLLQLNESFNWARDLHISISIYTSLQCLNKNIALQSSKSADQYNIDTQLNTVITFQMGWSFITFGDKWSTHLTVISLFPP